MKQLVFFISILISFSIHAQLIIDDFSTGTFKTTFFTKKTNDKLYQNGDGIIGKIRMMNPIVDYNPSGRSMQVDVNKGEMGINYPFDTRGKVILGYGYSKDGKNLLRTDILKYKKLKIAFKGKSTISGINVTFYAKGGAAVHGNLAKAWEGKYIWEFKIEDMNIGKTTDLSQLNQIYIQIDARSKTGCNMAIDKIWFE